MNERKRINAMLIIIRLWILFIVARAVMNPTTERLVVSVCCLIIVGISYYVLIDYRNKNKFNEN